jgi:predicted acylesterase/phospholipase RssA
MSDINIKAFKDSKIGFVLSGGVVKAAAWHLGVSKALNEMGFNFKHNTSPLNQEFEISTYVGSSAGSLIALYFCAGFTAEEIINATLGVGNSKIKPISYKEMFSFRKKMPKPPNKLIKDFEDLPFIVKAAIRPFLGISGFLTTESIRKYIIENILSGDQFKDYKADLFVVATQLDHSRKVIFSKFHYPSPVHDKSVSYYTNVPVADAVAASMSVPPIYSPFPIQNKVTGQIDYYIDGEIRDTLSTHVASDHDCNLIISSWTHTPYHYHDEVGSLVNYGIPAITLQMIYLMIQKKIEASRAKNLRSQNIIEIVNKYMLDNGIENKHRKAIVNILETKLSYKAGMTYIDINPKNDDYFTFFRNSFSLEPTKNKILVQKAYDRTMEVFKNREWEK